jgi:hypothetical protein
MRLRILPVSPSTLDTKFVDRRLYLRGNSDPLDRLTFDVRRLNLSEGIADIPDIPYYTVVKIDA